MTYAETLHFLYHSLPVFQHIGGNAYKPGFGNITELEKELGEPHRRFRSVHVAGTNGKGSVSHMTAAVLQAAGYRTGLFTSPHLKDFRERIHPKKDFRLEDPEFFPQPYYQVFQERLGFLPNLSIIDLLFNMGPESLLVLQQSNRQNYQ